MTPCMVYHVDTYCYSLQEECGESVCGVQLTEVNVQISNTFPRLVAAFSTADSYLSLLARGQNIISVHLPLLLCVFHDLLMHGGG